jgi:large subunit ribosomal protein L15
MKLHELSPAPGSRRKRTRVGRGIAAGGGKTAGRGTKGQKARAGGSIPPWFEGGQTPLHQRIPKLRGFRNPFKIDYEIVNLGRIAALVELGALEPGELPGSKKPAATAPITVNQEILRAVGAVRTLDKPLKVLGHGEIDTPLFVVADAFSKSAVAKIEAAGGSVQVLEVPTTPLAALGVGGPDKDEASKPARSKPATRDAKAAPAADAPAAAPAPEAHAPEATADTVIAEPEAEAAMAEAAADETPAEAPAPARAPKTKPSAKKATTEESEESAEAPSGEDA